MAQIDTSIYNRQTTPDFVGSFMKGRSFREMLDQQQQRKDVRSAFQNAIVEQPGGGYGLDQQRALSELAKADPQTFMRYQQQIQSKEQQRQAGLMKQAQSGLRPTTDPTTGKVTGFEADPNAPLSFDKKYKQAMLDMKKKEFGFKSKEYLGKTKKEGYKLVDDLRKERSSLPTTKATQEVSAAYNKVQASAKAPSAAGDLSMIFNYMKMLDPSSVVRESEFKSAAQARAWLSKMDNSEHRIPGIVRQGLQKLDKGTFLLPEQRADFLNQAKGLYAAQTSIQDQVDSRFANIAQERGIDPKNVLLDFRAQDVSKGKPKTVIQNGHTYKLNPKTGEYE